MTTTGKVLLIGGGALVLVGIACVIGIGVWLVTAGARLSKEVDKQGKAICLTTTLEHAELKRDQIHAYGPDQRSDKSKGSMSASIEAEISG